MKTYEEEFADLFKNGMPITYEDLDDFFNKTNIDSNSHAYSLFKRFIKASYSNGYIDGMKDFTEKLKESNKRLEEGL